MALKRNNHREQNIGRLYPVNQSLAQFTMGGRTGACRILDVGLGAPPVCEKPVNLSRIQNLRPPPAPSISAKPVPIPIFSISPKSSSTSALPGCNRCGRNFRPFGQSRPHYAKVEAALIEGATTVMSSSWPKDWAEDEMSSTD